jgi:hypothetical protein
MAEKQDKARLWPEIVYVDKHGAAKPTKSLDLPFREGFGLGLVAAQTRYMDKVLAQAEIAEPSQWSKIVAVRRDVPSVRRLMQHSPLEMNAAILFTTLAFSPQSQWRTIIQNFFKECGLDAEIPRGRPRLNPSKVTVLACGKLIEKAQTELKHGFAIKAVATRKGDFSSDDEHITAKLRACGYHDQQIAAILEATSIGDAACRYFQKAQGPSHRRLKRIRNIFSEYKLLNKRF